MGYPSEDAEHLLSTLEEYEDDLLGDVYTEDSKVDCEFSDVNIEEQTPLEEIHKIDNHAYAD